MRHRPFTIHLPFVAALIISASVSAQEIDFSHFADTYPTASGRWVRIPITESGIYEISFAQLAEMGFTDPQAVAIVGKGGMEMTPNFLDSTRGNATFPGSAPVCATMVAGDKLYFYANGTEDIRFASNQYYGTDYELGGTFKRISFNQYSAKGYYFLTDALPPRRVEKSIVPADPIAVDYGVDYRYFEEDLVHNDLNCGQLYWGCTLTPQDSKAFFDVSMPGLRTDIEGVIECSVHYNSYCSNSRLNFGTESADDLVTANFPSSTPYNYVPVPNAIGQISLMEENDKVLVDFAYRNAVLPSKCYLDYWILTWGKSAPTLSSEAQSRFLLPAIKKGNGYSIPDASSQSGLTVWDVSDCYSPMEIPRADNCIMGIAASDTPALIWFDTAQRQFTVDGFEVIGNSDIHARAAQGAEMLIITIPSLRAYADEIAEAHRADSGLDVMVAEVGDIYNEFSGGTPDVMAYKWLIKMLALNPAKKLENVLLFGPVTSDLRGIKVPKNPDEWIIGYQHTNVSRTAGATNPNDFLVMLDDFSNYSISSRQMALGIGVLPVRNETEAGIAVDKIKTFLSERDFAYYLNNMLWMACPGDEHMSEISAQETLDKFNNYTDSSFLLPAVVADDFTSSEEARKRFAGQMKKGSLMTLYFGHGDPSGLSKSYNLLSPAHLRDFTNDKLSFAIFAGCSISNFDRDGSGIGEKMVINMRNGFIGALIATRETYNNENKSFMNAFFKSMFLKEGSTRLDAPRTLGEICKVFKNRLSAANKFSFHLMCDPALTLPVPTLSIHAGEGLSATQGKRIELSGTIVDNEGNAVSDFNGEIVARLMSPTIQRQSEEFLSSADTRFTYAINDQMENIVSATVTGGRYKVSLPVPPGMEPTPDAMIAISAYDPSRHLGAASRIPVEIKRTAGTVGNADNSAPTISDIAYNVAAHAIDFTVTDNQCLNLATTPTSQGVEFSCDGNGADTHNIELTSVDSDCREASFRVKLPDVSLGDHRISIKACDLAGNAAQTECVVTVGGCYPSLSLSTEHVDHTRAEFDITGGTAWTLHIEDADGNRIRDISGNGDKAAWEFDNASGLRVAPGLYKAWLSAANLFSPKVIIPVIAQ